MDRTELNHGWSLPPAVIAGAFALALCPLLVDHLLFHPDERHYVDAALEILSTGDWLTPRTAAGDLRLQKPVLAYWFAALGAYVWGPSPFSVRWLFLLSGAATVWCGARAARIISGSAIAATVVACLLACHPALLAASTRSLPDIVMALFLTGSMAGFLTILTQRRADWAPLLAAYLGGALAVLAKGAPAVAFVMYGTAYIVWTERTLLRAQWHRFVTAAGLAALVSISWFLVMTDRHGGELGRQFLVDQGAAHRFAAHPVQILLQSLESTLLLGVSFVVFLLPAIRPLCSRRRIILTYVKRPAFLFLTGWIGLFVICTAFINHVNLRYLLPAVVPLAIVLGCLIVELDSPLLRRNLRMSAGLTLGVLLLTGLASCWLSLGSGLLVPLLAVATALILQRLRLQLRYTSITRSVTVACAALLTAILVLSASYRLHVGPSFGYQMATALRQRTPAGSPVVLQLIGHAAHASKVRICSGGDVHVQHVPPSELALVRPFHGAVAALDPSDLPSDSIRKPMLSIACGFEGVDVGEVWKAWRAGTLPDYLAVHQRTYTLLIPDADRPDAVESPTSTAGAEHSSVVR
ncbi:MAG: ArnT family glycosyltransferase [Planctomycetaceae bacterium]